MPEYDAILAAPMCRLGARFTGAALTRLDFLPADTPASSRLDARVRQLARELDAYWGDPAHAFDLLFVPQGTPFQLRVWEALLRIPEGRVLAYGDVARQAGVPGAVRAVGTAIGQNPVAYLIPCHRVIQSSGALGDYHWGPARKRALLALERARHEQPVVA